VVDVDMDGYGGQSAQPNAQNARVRTGTNRELERSYLLKKIRLRRPGFRRWIIWLARIKMAMNALMDLIRGNSA
jgi:hypothetical protein